MALVLPCAFALLALALLRVCGLWRPFAVPTGGMAPTIASGDYVLMEGISFLLREPRVSEVVVFRTDRVPGLPPSQFFVQRVAGTPGDRLRFSSGELSVNGRRFFGAPGDSPTRYVLPPNGSLFRSDTDLVVPAGQFFLLGDNTSNSLDSRYWGFLPSESIVGRVVFRYWPPRRAGRIE